jgi:3-oxoadipate enol-lactonase
MAAYYKTALELADSALLKIGTVLDDVIQDGFDRQCNRSTTASFDGARLEVFATGPRDGLPVVLVPPCGMPAKLCQGLMRGLARDHFVITWEGRGLFGETNDFDNLDCSAAAQAKDLFAVMRHFGVDVAHVLGLCGGAVIALLAAAERPAQISSLSLWHGDFELGSDFPKTTHQRNLKSLMSIAGGGRAEAASVHKLFVRSTLPGVRADLAHLTLYPYASAELLFRYGKLNGSIMNTDIRQTVARVFQPTLVVTSKDDSTAHPAGSMHVADCLPKATLRVRLHGDHLSLFDAPPEVTNLAAQFIAHQTAARTARPA